MSKNSRKRRKINGQLAEILEGVRNNSIFVIGGTQELSKKLELAIVAANEIDPQHWTIVSRAQILPEQFPELLPKRFPGKKLFVLFTWESFLPDGQISGDDFCAILTGLQRVCIEHDIKVIAIINSLEDDDFWTRLTEQETPRSEPHLQPRESIH